LAGYASKPVSLLIPAAQTLTYPVLREIPWGGILDRMVVQTLNGTATIRFLINSAMVATSPLNTTPIVVDFQSTSNNPTYFNAGDDLFLQVTAAGSNPTIHLSLYLLSLSG
jgi:hypothetical protein